MDGRVRQLLSQIYPAKKADFERGGFGSASQLLIEHCRNKLPDDKACDSAALLDVLEDEVARIWSPPRPPKEWQQIFGISATTFREWRKKEIVNANPNSPSTKRISLLNADVARLLAK